MLKRVLYLMYGLISMGLVVMGYTFENPFGMRKYILVALCLVFLTMMWVEIIYLHKHRIQWIALVLMAILLFAIELYSKYAMNYFFHTIYLLLIFYTIVHMQTKDGIILSVSMTVLSFVKFMQLIYIAATFANISLMVFFGSFQILIVIVGVFLRVYREESKKSTLLYKELLKSHDQLKAYTKQIKMLSQMEARTMIARDLHDTLGHDMTALIMQMEMASSCYDEGDIKAGANFLKESKKSARDSLVKVREIVETLKQSNERTTIRNTIEELIDDFSKKTGCKIQLTEEGHHKLKQEVNLVLYRVIQESLTNALRHGKATLIYISLIYREKEIDFLIKDNGVGCGEIEPGNGLKGMKERLDAVAGVVEVRTSNHGLDSAAKNLSGCTVKGRIPYESNHN